MTGNNILGIIYSNKYDECLNEITGLRTTHTLYTNFNGNWASIIS